MYYPTGPFYYEDDMNISQRFLNAFLFLAVFFALAISADLTWATKKSNECVISGWPSEYSDLKPDPSLIRGELENGMRYVVMENHEPKDRVALYLYIKAGSLNENEDQRGVAHFLEHMLFNGTTNFPPGELVHFFQDIGMSFGGDTNAHTSYDETVYNIMLPVGTMDVLRKGLTVMADYARGALLLEEEVDREREVILAEKRSRDSASYRAFVAASTFKYRGTLLPERQVIGKKSVLQTADRNVLKNYYDTWYRPENMILVLVGDIQGEEVLPVITELFSPLVGDGGEATCPDIGELETYGEEVFYHYEKELGRTKVAIESLWNNTPENDSRLLEMEELQRYASILAMANRLQKLEEQKGDLVAGLGYYSGGLLQRIRYSTIVAETSGERWPETLELLDSALRQTILFGFQQEEVERVKKDILTGLESAVLTKKSRDSEMLARAIIHQFSENRVFQSPEQELELYSTLLATMTVDDVNKIFRKDWSSVNRIVSVYGDAEIEGDDAEKTIASQYTKFQDVEPAPYSENVTGEFPYLYPERVAQDSIVTSEKDAILDVDRITFANNVVVNLKRTDFEPNTVKVVVDVGKGKLSEPLPGLTLMANEVLNDSGTGTLQRSALADLMSGTTVNVHFSIGEESLRWHGSAVNDDSELLLQLLYSLISDPGLRQQAYVKAQNTVRQFYESMETTLQGAIQTEVEPFFASGDMRAGLPPLKQVEALQLKQIQDWLLPQISHGSMEVAIVGDFDPEQMKQLVLNYFGSLPQREQIAVESSQRTFPVGENLVVDVTSSIEKSIILVAWPTSGFWDIQRTRRLHVLAELLRERLRLVIREKLGASYAPTVSSSPSRVYEEYGIFLAQVVVAPGREQEIVSEIQKIAEQLRKEGVSSEELERIKGPLMTGLKDSVRKNDYWLYSVLANSTRYPQLLTWPATLFADIDSITASEITKLAQQYLVPGKEAMAIVRPKGKM